MVRRQSDVLLVAQLAPDVGFALRRVLLRASLHRNRAHGIPSTQSCCFPQSAMSSDDAHDLFTKTFNPSFVQKESAMHSERRSQASKLLSSVAQKLQNPRLATLAVRVRLDAFTRVKKAIDDMVAQLLKEKEDEIKHKDFCVEEFNSNELQTEKKEREKA